MPTPDRPLTPRRSSTPRDERVIGHAEQTYNMPNLIEGRVRDLNLQGAIAEIVDNFLDTRLQGVPMVITIKTDSREGTVTFDCTGTRGMSQEEMTNFPKWATRSKAGSTNQIGFFGEGGKLAILSLLRRNGNTSVKFTSQPPGDIIFIMELENWWSNLEPGYRPPIRSTVANASKQGRTVIKLTGVETEKLTRRGQKPGDLCEWLGTAYSKFLTESTPGGERSLIIKVQGDVSPGSRGEFTVQPIEFPFIPGSGKPKSYKIQGFGGEEIGITIRAGQIDPAEAKRRAQARNAYYGTQSAKPTPPGVYLINNGRLLTPPETPIPFRTLGIHGVSTERMSLSSYIVAVYLEGAPTTVLKTGLSLNTPELEQIKAKIIRVAGKEIREMAGKEIREDQATQSHRKTVAGTSTVLETTLQYLLRHEEDLLLRLMPTGRKEMLLPAPFVPEKRGQSGSQTDTGVVSLPQLPTDTPAARRTVSHTAEPQLTRQEAQKLPIDPVPEVVLESFGQNFPVATVEFRPVQKRNSTSLRPTVVLNFNSPEVRSILTNTRGSKATEHLLPLAGRAFIAHLVWQSTQEEKGNSINFTDIETALLVIEEAAAKLVETATSQGFMKVH